MYMDEIKNLKDQCRRGLAAYNTLTETEKMEYPEPICDYKVIP